MSDKVYLVVKGDYSDYSIYLVTLDHKVAEDYVAAMNQGAGFYDRYDIEEFDLEVGPVEVWHSLRLETSITSGHPPRPQARREERNVGTKSLASRAETEIRQYRHTNYSPLVITTTGWDFERVEKTHSEAVAREYAILSGVA